MKTMHLANEAIAEACRLPVRAALCAVVAASCALVANGAPVAFKDAAKIKSWDAWDDHKTPEPPKEKPCVTRGILFPEGQHRPDHCLTLQDLYRHYVKTLSCSDFNL